MASIRGTFAVRVGLSAATAVLILAGASLNVSGRTGQAALIAAVAGLLALGAGAINVNWKISAPLGAAALLAAKHRVFLAATSDAQGIGEPGDIGALTSSIAGQIGAAFASCYLASPDGKQFVPQPPGFGL